MLSKQIRRSELDARRKLQALLSVAVLTMGCSVDSGDFQHRVRAFERIERDLEAVDSALRANPRLIELDDGSRAFGVLNGTPVMKRSYTGDSVVKGPFVDRHPVESILKRDSISIFVYDSIRAILGAAHVIYAKVTPGYTILMTGGMLDNLSGYILMQPGGQPPSVDDDIAGGRIVFIRPLNSRWFYFATS